MKDDKEQTQKTPKGYEIPIPTREDFEKVLDAVAKPTSKPPEPSPKRGPKK